MNWKKTLLICLAILLIAVAATYLIFSTEPTAQRQGATKQTAMLVDVIKSKRGNYQPTIVVTGTVQPAEDIMLSPRISGEIVQRASSFVPGGYVKKGEMLLQIDPSDYKNTLALRKSDLSQARADLKLEQGRQDVARTDYQLINDTLPANNQALVLRQPQLDAAQARVDAAEAAIQQAELQLERTTIRAPFDAHILSRNANLGSQVAPGTNLGRLVGLDEYWVMLTVPQSQLRWLTLPSGNDKGSEVKIYNRNAWPEGAYRTGYLYRLMGALEGQTRLARVLVRVPDPLAYQNDALPPLMIGAFVEANIKAAELKDVVRLKRDYVRDDEKVWVMQDSILRIQEVDIVFRDAKYAYIKGGLSGQEQIVTTNLSTVVDGAKLRLEADSALTQVNSPDISEQ